MIWSSAPLFWQIVAMHTQVQCPSCFASFEVSSSAIGKVAKCTKCGERFRLMEAAQGAKGDAHGDFGAPPAPSDRRPESSYGANAAPAPPPLPSPPYRAEFSPSVTMAPESETRSNARQFWALRAVARFYEILAILVGVAVAVVIVGSVVLLIQNEISGQTEFEIIDWMIGNLVTLLYAVLAVTGLCFVAQMIRLGLQIEQNTYETRDACTRMAAEFREGASGIRRA